MGRLPETKRFTVFVLDHATRMADSVPNAKNDGRICAVIDLAGLRFRNLDVSALRYLFDTLRHHYPDRLGRMLFVDAPGIFLTVWRMLQPGLNDETRSKISFISSRGGQAGDLHAVFAPAPVPDVYGGESPLIPITQAVQDHQGRTAAAAAAAVEGARSSGRLGWMRRRLRRDAPPAAQGQQLPRWLLPGVWAALVRGVSNVVAWAWRLPVALNTPRTPRVARPSRQLATVLHKGGQGVGRRGPGRKSLERHRRVKQLKSHAPSDFS